MPRSHHPGGSSESHVEVQSKSFPEASGPSLVLSARLGLTAEKNGKKEWKRKLCFISPAYTSAEFQNPFQICSELLVKSCNFL